MNLDALSRLLHGAVYLPAGEALAGGALRVVPELLDGVPPLLVNGGNVTLEGILTAPIPAPDTLAEAAAGGGPAIDRMAATLSAWMIEAAASSPASVAAATLLVAATSAQAAESAGEAHPRAPEVLRAGVVRALAAVHRAEVRVPRLAAAVSASPAVFRVASPVTEAGAPSPALLASIGTHADPARIARAVEVVRETLADVAGRAGTSRALPADAAVLTVVPRERALAGGGWPVELFPVVLGSLGALRHDGSLPEDLGDHARIADLAAELSRLWRQLGRWEVLSRLARVVASAPRRAPAGEATVLAVRLGGLRTQPAQRIAVASAVARMPAEAPRVDLGELLLVAFDDVATALREAAALGEHLPAPVAMALAHGALEARGDGARWHLWGPAAEAALRSVLTVRTADAGTLYADAAVASRVERGENLGGRVRVEPGAGDRAGRRLSLRGEAAVGAPAGDPFGGAPAVDLGDPFGATPAVDLGDPFAAAPPAPAVAAAPSRRPESDPFAETVAGFGPGPSAPSPAASPAPPPAAGDPFAAASPAPPPSPPEEDGDDPFSVPMLDDIDHGRVAADPFASPPPAAPPPPHADDAPSFFLPGVDASPPASSFQLEVVEEEDDSSPRLAPAMPATPITPRGAPLPRVDLPEMLKGYVWFRNEDDMVFGRVYGKRVIDEHRYATADSDAAYVAFLRDKIREGFVPRTELVGDLPGDVRPAPLDLETLTRAWSALG